MKVYWVRHGRTHENEKQTYYGKLETRLTEGGIQEVKQIRTSFDDCLNVYVSPAARAMETASLLFNDLYFKADSRLLERNMGVFEGKTYEEIKKTYPKECTMWEKEWQSYQIPEGESALEQYERVCEFIKELERLDEDSIVIAHAGTIRMAIVYMLGGNLDNFWKFKVDTGTVVTTNYSDNYWYVEFSKKYQ